MDLKNKKKLYFFLFVFGIARMLVLLDQSNQFSGNLRADTYRKGPPLRYQSLDVNMCINVTELLFLYTKYIVYSK